MMEEDPFALFERNKFTYDTMIRYTELNFYCIIVYIIIIVILWYDTYFLQNILVHNIRVFITHLRGRVVIYRAIGTSKQMHAFAVAMLRITEATSRTNGRLVSTSQNLPHNASVGFSWQR